MGISLPLAEAISFWANWALVGALILGVVSTALIVMSANVKEEHWAHERDATGERISANETETAKALEGAAKANETSARLTASNIELATALERERAARLVLEERIKPREITPAQEAIFAAVLATAPRGPVYVVPDWMDPEAKLFGAQIEMLLKKLGFPVPTLTSPGKPLSYGKLGAFFVIRDAKDPPPHLSPLYRAFKSAGFEFVVYEEQYVPDVQSVLIGISVK